jgi:hypothetical protein
MLVSKSERAYPPPCIAPTLAYRVTLKACILCRCFCRSSTNLPAQICPCSQVVDARDPLLYRSTDLESYAHDLHASKTSLVLLNKADLLPINVREAWADFFDKVRKGRCLNQRVRRCVHLFVCELFFCLCYDCTALSLPHVIWKRECLDFQRQGAEQTLLHP